MKKPLKLVYKIEATNKHVFVRYIQEDYYEGNKNSASWNVISHTVEDIESLLEDGPSKKKTIYTNFGTGEAAEEFIIGEIEKYKADKAAYDEYMAEEIARKAVANDNYAKLIHEEKVWREANKNGKVFK